MNVVNYKSFHREVWGQMGYTSLLDLLSLMENPKPEGITFNDFKFSQPVQFRFCTPLRMAGVYAILKQNWAPTAYLLPFEPVYFGETENFAERVTRSHEHYDDWVRAVGSEADIWVAFHWTIPGDRDARLAVEDSLIKYYDPCCNKSLRYQTFLKALGF